jgi:hypothetical protein
MTANVESIVNGFPHNIISPVIGMPTYATISKVNLWLNSNAASVHSYHRNGTLGLVALITGLAVYTTFSNIPFEVPVNPGSYPDIHVNASGAQVKANTRAHKENLQIWREYLVANKAVKQQLLSAIQEVYYKTLCHRITGYSTVTTRQIITHLYATYGTITLADLADNDPMLKATFNWNLINQIKDAIDLAASSRIHTSNLVFLTGVFANVCQD